MKEQRLLARRMAWVNPLVVLTVFLGVWLAGPPKVEAQEEIWFIDTHNHDNFAVCQPYNEV